MEVGQEGVFNKKLIAFYEEWRGVLTQLLAEKMPLDIVRQQAYLLHVQYEGAV